VLERIKLLSGRAALRIRKWKGRERERMRKWKGRERKPKYKSWEILRVFDEVAGHPWTGVMPLSILKEHLPLSCRYTFEVANNRYLGMAVGGLIVFVGSFLALSFTPFSILLQVIGAILLAPIGVLIGYLKGYEFFMDSPVWMVRRLYKRKLPEGKTVEDVEDYLQLEIDYDSFPIIESIEHTKLTGMPMAMASAERRESARVAILALKQQASNSNSGGATTLTKIEEANLAAAYSPRAFRASSLYEMLQARAVKTVMRSKSNKSNKLRDFGMGAGTALIAIGILIFAMLIFGE